MTTRPAVFPSNPYAPVRSIQSKFHAILQETQTFQKETDQANRERARVEQHLQQLRQKQKELADQSRVAQEAMGSFHRERAMLLNEQARLRKVLKDERVALEQCCADNDKLASEDTARKEAYCKAMIDASQELSGLLLKQEEHRLQNLITVETVPALLSAFQQTSPESSVGNDSLSSKLEEAIEALKKATDDYNTTVEDEKCLQKQVKDLRARALEKTFNKDSNQRVSTLGEPPFTVFPHAMYSNTFFFIALYRSSPKLISSSWRRFGK